MPATRASAHPGQGGATRVMRVTDSAMARPPQAMTTAIHSQKEVLGTRQAASGGASASTLPESSTRSTTTRDNARALIARLLPNPRITNRRPFYNGLRHSAINLILPIWLRRAGARGDQFALVSRPPRVEKLQVKTGSFARPERRRVSKGWQCERCTLFPPSRQSRRGLARLSVWTSNFERAGLPRSGRTRRSSRAAERAGIRILIGT